MSLRTEPAHRLASDRADDRRIRTRRRLRAADLLVVVCWSSVALAVALYLVSGGLADVTDAATAITAGGIITGLIGTDLILVMLVLAARIPLIDRTVGQDRAMVFHRALGKPALYLILAHGALLTVAYALSDGTNVVTETISLFGGPDLALAYLGLGLLVIVVVTSVVAARRRFSYEAWHLVHLLSYAAVLVAPAPPAQHRRRAGRGIRAAHLLDRSLRSRVRRDRLLPIHRPVHSQRTARHPRRRRRGDRPGGGVDPSDRTRARPAADHGRPVRDLALLERHNVVARASDLILGRADRHIGTPHGSRPRPR